MVFRIKLTRGEIEKLRDLEYIAPSATGNFIFRELMKLLILI